MTFDPGAASTAPQGLLAWEHARFDRITSDLALPEATVCALHCATRSVTVELPLTHDDGSTAALLGYRVQLVVLRVGPDPSAAGLDRGGRTPSGPRPARPHPGSGGGRAVPDLARHRVEHGHPSGRPCHGAVRELIPPQASEG